MAHQTQLEVQ